VNEWTFCDVHLKAVTGGSCDECNGDRHLVQVVRRYYLDVARSQVTDMLALVRAVWPISELDSAYIPTCRYCGSQEGTVDGEEFVHKETCAWLRLRNALQA
jgi:hypothetical protein